MARAAKSRSAHLMLSTGASAATEEVIAARGAPIWQQLYATDDWPVTQEVVRRAEKAGCTAIVLTVDSPGLRNVETLKRATLADNRDCGACHYARQPPDVAARAVFPGLDVSRVTGDFAARSHARVSRKAARHREGLAAHQGHRHG